MTDNPPTNTLRRTLNRVRTYQPDDLHLDPRRQVSIDPPSARGLLHGIASPLSLLPAIALVALAPTWLTAVAFGVFGVTVTVMFTTSGVFHLASWSDQGWWRMRNLDMNAIALLIAGEYTGFATVLLDGRLRLWLLVGIWLFAGVSIVIRWLPTKPPYGFMTATFIAMSSMALVGIGPLAEVLGPRGFALLAGGCLCYLIGALMLGARRPDPWPEVFGYHEIWHVLVTVAIILHYACMFFFVVPIANAKWA